MDKQEYFSETIPNKKQQKRFSKEITKQREQIRKKIIKKEGNVIYVQFREEKKDVLEASNADPTSPKLSNTSNVKELEASPQNPQSNSPPSPPPSPETPNTSGSSNEPPPPPPQEPPPTPHKKSWKRVLVAALGLTTATIGGVVIGRNTKECPVTPEQTHQPLTPPNVPPPPQVPPLVESSPQTPPPPVPGPPPPPSEIPSARPKIIPKPKPIPQNQIPSPKAEKPEPPPKLPPPPPSSETTLIPIQKLPPEQRFHFSLDQVRHGFYSAIENSIMKDMRESITKNPLFSRSVALETAAQNQKRAQQIMVQHGLKLDPATFHRLCQIATDKHLPLQDILRNAEFLNALDQQFKTMPSSALQTPPKPSRLP